MRNWDTNGIQYGLYYTVSYPQFAVGLKGVSISDFYTLEGERYPLLEPDLGDDGQVSFSYGWSDSLQEKFMQIMCDVNPITKHGEKIDVRLKVVGRRTLIKFSMPLVKELSKRT